MKNNKPLTPKQREKLAREARQKNAASRKPSAAAVKEKPSMPKNTKRFIVLVAALLLFATLASVLFGFSFALWRTDPTASVYDTIKFKDYLMLDEMGKDFYKGKTLDLSAYQRADVTDEEFDAHLADLLLRNRKEIALCQKNTVIGKGDDIAYYLIGAKKQDGTPVMESYISTLSYTSPLSLTVGNAVFSEAFDTALTEANVKPSDSFRETVTYGGLSDAEVVIVTFAAYTAEKVAKPDEVDLEKKYTWKSTAGKTMSAGRLALSSLDERLCEALVENVTELRENTVFYLEDYDLTGDGTKDLAVKFEVIVHAVVTDEEAVEITFTPPKGYFTGTDVENFEGALTFSLVIDYMNDYEMPELDKDFITETMDFTPTATDEAGIIAEFKTAERKAVNDARKLSREEIISYTIKMLAEQTVTGANGKPTQIFINHGFSTNPDEPTYDADYTAALNEAYSRLIEDYRSAYGKAPTSEELTAYAQGVYGASTVDDVIQSNFKQTLFMYYIFRDAGLKITDDMVEEAYGKHLASLVEDAGDPELYNEEYFIALYSEEGLYKQARQNLVYDLVGGYLLENNTISTEKTGN